VAPTLGTNREEVGAEEGVEREEEKYRRRRRRLLLLLLLCIFVFLYLMRKTCVGATTRRC